MGITAKFSKQDISKQLSDFRRKVEKDVVKILQKVGEEFVKDARNMTKAEGGFGDDTGNLRSSISYFIFKDGVLFKSNISGTAEGINAARRVLDLIEIKGGYQIIGVAGMRYASWVESKGYNVITSQADIALVSLDRILKKYEARMNAMGITMDFDVSYNSVQTALV